MNVSENSGKLGNLSANKAVPLENSILEDSIVKIVILNVSNVKITLTNV